MTSLGIDWQPLTKAFEMAGLTFDIEDLYQLVQNNYFAYFTALLRELRVKD